jgi:hypothetical protein
MNSRPRSSVLHADGRQVPHVNGHPGRVDIVHVGPRHVSAGAVGEFAIPFREGKTSVALNGVTRHASIWSAGIAE